MTGAPIFVGFAALAALLCWLLIYARGHWAVKAATTVAVLAFSFAVWHAIGTYGGWPTAAAPPKDAVFISAIVIEPNVSQGEPGAIYLWLVPNIAQSSVLGYDSRASEPRAYRLPYSEPLNATVQQAKGMQHGGMRAVGLAQSKSHGNGAKGSAGGRYHPYILPPPTPPRKGLK